MSDNQLRWKPPAEIVELAAGDDCLVALLIETFRDETTARLEKIGAALCREDRAAVGAEFHGIKSGARQLGADALADTCQKMEFAAPASPWTELARGYRLAQEQFAQIYRAMANEPV